MLSYYYCLFVLCTNYSFAISFTAVYRHLSRRQTRNIHEPHERLKTTVGIHVGVSFIVENMKLINSFSSSGLEKEIGTQSYEFCWYKKYSKFCFASRGYNGSTRKLWAAFSEKYGYYLTIQKL